ncbi:PREDICTED: uncharacterized protein LOC105459371 [Wasmannia auropunctata]|uniref:uncharacterized protein LOC105459371 n=1 Tax=Wasmannia auropunctata TaxID=64793 RepID=UPI0005EF5B16|nr:PREDICTED: uncharacterized protein LOC105459371 [Wasmannia auropunctata]
MNKLLALVLLAAYTAAGPTNVLVQPSQHLNCLEHENEFFSCVFAKTISAVDRAARSNDIEIVDGVTFVRETPMERIGKNLETNEIEIMNEISRENSDSMGILFNKLIDSTVSFLKSHSLKLNMPKSLIPRTLNEGRGKIKKMILPLIAAAGLKIFAFLPILFIGLGALAVKALIFGKFALLVASVMAFQKLFGGNGSFFNKNPAPWFDNGAAGGGAWIPSASAGLQHQGYRSFDRTDAEVDAHDLAYSAHAPVANGTD